MPQHPGDNAPDPMQSARRLSRPVLPRRFYDRAEISQDGSMFALLLDGKRALTPARNPLVIPGSLAEAIWKEWSAQADLIDPNSMPATRLANSAIDGVASRMQDVRDAIAAYVASDLICYRAAEPVELVARQSEAWDPILAWAERFLGGRFVLAQGVMPVAQSATVLENAAAQLAAIADPFRLTALHLATNLTGSALIALALAAGVLDAEIAWSAAHVDEDWNIRQWGADAEAMERRARRFADFGAAALVFANPAP